MTHDTTSGPATDLGWLLTDFVSRVPGAESALLASSDGIKLAVAGLAQDEADSMAAVMAGLHSLAKGAGRDRAIPRTVRQIVLELDDGYLFVMSAGSGLPRQVQAHVGTDSSTVGTVLGVRTGADATPGVVGHEMATLIKSVSEHLVTPTRQVTVIR